MSRIFSPTLILLFSLVLFLPSFAKAQEKLVLGKRPPLLELGVCVTDATLNAPDWDALRGKTVILEFWGTWCGPCIGSLRKIQELCNGRDDLFVIAINDEALDRQSKIAGQCPSIHFFRDPDDKMFERFEAIAIPHCVVVGPNGVVQAITMPENITAKVLDQLRDGASIKLPTKSGPAADLQWDLARERIGEGTEPNFQVIVEPTRTQTGGFHLPPGGRRYTADGVRFQSVAEIACDVTALHIDCQLPARILDQQYRISVWVPQGREQELRTTIKQALNAIAPVSIEVKPTERNVLVATLTGAELPKRSDRLVGSMAVSRGRMSSSGVTMKQLLTFVENFEQLPIVDETSIDYRFDIELDYDVNDVGVLRSQLADKLQMSLARATKTIPIVQIREKESTLRKSGE
jgi:thiol-disulfide isomerase/thioredoxin